MSVNERLVEIIERVDDRIYKDTARRLREANIDCLKYHRTSDGRIPPISGINHHVYTYGMRILLKESSETGRES